MNDLEKVQHEFREQVKEAVNAVPKLVAQAEKYGGVDEYVDSLVELWTRRAVVASKDAGENHSDIFQKTIVKTLQNLVEYVGQKDVVIEKQNILCKECNKVISVIDKADADRGFYRNNFERKPDSFEVLVNELPSNVNIPKFEKLRFFEKWVRSFLDEGGSITIESTGQICRFAHSGVHDSLKKAKNDNHRRTYVVLRNMIRKAEYDYSVHPDTRHKTEQDVYRAALRINDELYAVKIKLDVVSEYSKIMAKGRGNTIYEDVHYKDHRLTKIEIAPTLIYGRHPEGVAHQNVDAISWISLGVLRGNVKPTRIEKNKLFQKKEIFHGSVTLKKETYFINLFSSANLSTLAHEMGHIFFLELERAVQQGLADHQLQADYKTLCKSNASNIQRIIKKKTRPEYIYSSGWQLQKLGTLLEKT